MSASKIMISLPEQLSNRMRAVIPARQRSKIFASLIEREVTLREENLYNRALELENNVELQQEMQHLDNNLHNDGLDEI